MSQACALLLSEKDYSDEEVVRRDGEKLLQIFQKCQAACKAIQNSASPVMPTLQASRGGLAARAQAKPLKPQGGKTMLPPRRSSMLAMSRSSMHVSSPSISSIDQTAGSLPPPLKLKREISDSSTTSTASVASVRSAKKPRTSPPLDVASKAPPASALQFLAQLNAPEKKQSNKKRDTSSTPTSSEEGSPTRRLRSLSSTGTRQQPSRNARR